MSPTNQRRPSRRHPVRVLSTHGLAYLANLDPRDATLVGRHWNAIRGYLDTGDSVELADFDNIEIQGADKQGIAVRAVLETDLDTIDMHAIRGDVSFESIYDEVQ